VKGLLLAAWRHRFFSPSNTESLTYWRQVPSADPRGRTHVVVTSGENLLSGMRSFTLPAGRFSVDV